MRDRDILDIAIMCVLRAIGINNIQTHTHTLNEAPQMKGKKMKKRNTRRETE